MKKESRWEMRRTRSSHSEASDITIGAMWAAVLPVLTIFLSASRASGGAAYAAAAGLPILAMGGGLIGLVAAVWIGSATDRLGPSVAGFLSGLLLSIPTYAVVAVIRDSQEATAASTEQESATQPLRHLVTLLQQGKRDELMQKLSDGKENLPELVCSLVRLNRGVHWRRDDLKPALSSTGLLQIADLAMGLDVASESKQAALYAVLQRLREPREGDQQRFPIEVWVSLWRRATGGVAAPNILNYDGSQTQTYATCEQRYQRDIALTVIAMGDAGILAMIDNGYTFTPEQFQQALLHAESAATVRQAAASGVDVNAVVVTFQNEWPADRAFEWRASHWSARLDKATDPAAIVELGEAFAAIYPSTNAKTRACVAFEQGERERVDWLERHRGSYLVNEVDRKYHPDSPARSNAAIALRKTLCLSGSAKPP